MPGPLQALTLGPNILDLAPRRVSRTGKTSVEFHRQGRRGVRGIHAAGGWTSSKLQDDLTLHDNCTARNVGTMSQVTDKHVPLHNASLPAWEVGAIAGVSGFLYGGVDAILRNRPTGIRATATGGLWLSMGYGYSLVRGSLLNSFAPDKASTLAAASVGVIRGALQGPRNILPGGIMFSLMGFIGQRLYDAVDGAGTARPQQDRAAGFWDRAAQKSWSPVTKLSNEEYAAILSEKKTKLDVDIALIDDRIAKLRTTPTENRPDDPR